MKTGCRFAAGEKHGLKSSIWKVQVSNNDIYVFTNLFGSDCKISLHESGQGQWSMSSEFVAKMENMKNQDRHIVKWTFNKPENDLAKNIFRIQIPTSELRDYPSDSLKKKVKWISGINSGTYQIDFCLTRPVDNNPCDNRTDLPYKVLDTLQLADKRWLVIFCHPVSLSQEELDKAKATVIKETQQKGIFLNDGGWITVFGNGNDGIPELIEFHYDKPLLDEKK